MRKIFFVFITIAVFTACKNNNSSAPAGNSEPVTVNGDVQENTGSEPSSDIKSVMYETETIMPEGIGTANSTVYTDDYGKKLRTESVTAFSAGGKSMNMTSSTLRLDDYAYTWSSMSKSGYKVKMDPSKFDPNSTDISKLSDEMKAKMNYKEEGTETINGKACKVASFSTEQMQGKVWIWKSVPMKMEMKTMGKVVVINVKKVEENPSIPAGTFELPKGVEFKEMPSVATK